MCIIVAEYSCSSDGSAYICLLARRLMLLLGGTQLQVHRSFFVFFDGPVIYFKDILEKVSTVTLSLGNGSKWNRLTHFTWALHQAEKCTLFAALPFFCFGFSSWAIWLGSPCTLWQASLLRFWASALETPVSCANPVVTGCGRIVFLNFAAFCCINFGVAASCSDMSSTGNRKQSARLFWSFSRFVLFKKVCLREIITYLCLNHQILILRGSLTWHFLDHFETPKSWGKKKEHFFQIFEFSTCQKACRVLRCRQ